MSEKSSSGTKNSKQTNKQTVKCSNEREKEGDRQIYRQLEFVRFQF